MGVPLLQKTYDELCRLGAEHGIAPLPILSKEA